MFVLVHKCKVMKWDSVTTGGLQQEEVPPEPWGANIKKPRAVKCAAKETAKDWP